VETAPCVTNPLYFRIYELDKRFGSKCFGSKPHHIKVKTKVFTYHFFNGRSSLLFYKAYGPVSVAATVEYLI
jgi:hypothetical protein